MPFEWSLNPYMGCVAPLHVLLRPGLRAAGRPAGRRPLRPFDPRQGRTSPRCSRAELGRRSWQRRAGRDRRRHRSVPARRGPLPAHARLPRGARARAEPVLAHHARADDRPRPRRAPGRRARAPTSRVMFSVPTLDREVWRTTEPGTAPPRQRLRALATLVDAGIEAGVGMAPILPGISDRPEQLAEVVTAAREAGATCDLGQPALPAAGDARALPRGARAATGPSSCERYEQLYDGPRVPSRRRDRPRPERGARPRRRARRSATAGGRLLAPPPEPVQLDALRCSAEARHTIPVRCRTRSPA